MANRELPSQREWFRNCGSWGARHIIERLKLGIDAGLIDDQDEYGMTALSLSVMSGWKEGIDELLRAGADTELRYYRTGDTALKMAVDERSEPIIEQLLSAGANPDAPNFWGHTPRAAAANTTGLIASIDRLPEKKLPLPPPRIQNVEHLADHYHPRFQIPDRKERESIAVGRAVNVIVYGPKSDERQDAVKVRIVSTIVLSHGVYYAATIETPIERTHLPMGTTTLEFGPEAIATVYLHTSEID